MAINNFIPTVWSEKLWRELDRQLIGAAHCSREYEGEIKEKGNKVKIIGIDKVPIHNYTKNSNMGNPSVLNEAVRELVIDQAKYFNFQIDDIDKTQGIPNVMDSVVKSAAKSLASVADQYIFSLYEDAGYILETSNQDLDEMMNMFLAARTILYRNDVNNDDDLVLEVTPDVATLILKSKIKLESDNVQQLENGCIGKLFGVKVFVSNNVATDYNTSGPDAPDGYHKCIMRTKRAIAYASQLSEIEAYRPELRFADAVKGLHLYGAKVIYPEEMVTIDVALYNMI